MWIVSYWPYRDEGANEHNIIFETEIQALAFKTNPALYFEKKYPGDSNNSYYAMLDWAGPTQLNFGEVF